MGQATKTISVEQVLEAIFSYLPDMSYSEGKQAFPVVFNYGDEVALNIFLKNRERSTTYPLLWMVYPFKEEHSQTKAIVSNVSFILAVDTNTTMQNKERMKETFGKILMPLFYNIRYALRHANIINTNSTYEIEKHPNYSSSSDRQASAGTFIWDAIKLTTSFTIIDTCLKPIKF